jgi:hypothetical protein
VIQRFCFVKLRDDEVATRGELADPVRKPFALEPDREAGNDGDEDGQADQSHRLQQRVALSDEGEKREGDDPPSTTITQTVRWAAPRSEGVEIRVYGVTECIAKPAKPSPDTHGPCLVEHTPLPASIRKLLATAPASDGVASWTWTGTFDCEIGLAYDPRGPAYHAIVLAAYSTSDHSIFAIAEPGMWSEPGPNDTVC